jgi:phospho-N-acetylmuramoyl-pentapeptide-transferase
MRKVKAHAAISQYTPEHAGKTGTPSMGGIAPLLALIIATIWISNIDYRPNVDGFVWPAKQFTAILVGLVGYGALGFIDDFLIPRYLREKRGLGWTQKLFVQLCVVAAMLFPLQPLPVATSVGIGFCVLFFANAINFADGLDGLCGGLLIVTSLFFVFGVVGQVAQALIGALIPFLILNAPPAKIFMGDVGALPFGATYGMLFANALWLEGLGLSMSTTLMLLLIVSLIFILELSLVPIQLFWVKVFKRRLIPASPVHHSFEKMGWPETRITATFILVQVVLTALAITLSGWWEFS